MPIDAKSTPSRRALLAGLVGGLATAVAGTLGRAQPVAATTPQPVLLGTNNVTTTKTYVANTASGHAIQGDADSGYGLLGTSASGHGVHGESTSSYGVYGYSGASIALYGYCGAASSPAALGWSWGGNSGLQGYSSDGFRPAPPAGPAKTGVYGSATHDESACGVTGETTLGRGVNGIATGGIGVFGQSTSSIGVYGQSDSDVGVKAFSSSNSALYGQSDTGYALETIGRLKLSTAGIATIPAGSTSKVMTSFLLTAGSFLLLTPGVDIGTRRLWFTKNVGAHTITIHLSSSRTTPTKISWLLVG